MINTIKFGVWLIKNKHNIIITSHLLFTLFLLVGIYFRNYYLIVMFGVLYIYETKTIYKSLKEKKTGFNVLDVLG